MNAVKMSTLAAALLLAGCAGVPSQKPFVQVPASLMPGDHEALVQVVPAKGEQIYECREVKDKPGSYDWSFVAPEAELFDAKGKRIGRHYAGPQWEAADGSKVQGSVKQRSDAPAAGSIPWLLLDAKSVGKEGAFSKVTSIQRVSTVGGVAPPGGCPLAGYQVRIPYTADYYFFTSK
jgi:hypothetical protein